MTGTGGGLRPSVVVVSRRRPECLARCLAALARQSRGLELVLVADPEAVGLRPDLPIKRVSFDQANISAARNAGLAQAAGDVVLFVDDDAIAGTEWVARMTAAFTDPRVIAATGFTRGPDGLNWQSRAERISASGRGYPITPEQAALEPEGGDPVSTIGTNCAFRRSALLAIGGFDPAFSYHLDESDVNRRMARVFPQGLTAILPRAQVIHGLAAGTSRAGTGVPHDLRAIGRSTAIFAARHGGDASWIVEAQRRRLLRLMVAGRLDPLAVGRILRSLREGLAEGAGHHALPAPCAGVPPAYLELPPAPVAPLFLAGWHWRARPLRAAAARAVAQGGHVTLLLLTPTALPHRLKMAPGGWWEQRGGIWGPSQPGDSAFKLGAKRARIMREESFFAALLR
ncbi:MAG: glycosyltransferase [Paracoccus sp. (in: a-proteobacteria)]|uniref:glycosyltransferase family 2 protein n=1 Tax=Paracoccus sp. TaxID=267 RepID=UPI0039E220F1